MLQSFYQDLKTYKQLTNEETIALILKARENNFSGKENDCIIKGNAKLILHIIKKKYGEDFNLDDIVTGMMAMDKAIRQFDESKELTFAAYAYIKIAYALKRYRLLENRKIKVKLADIQKEGFLEDNNLIFGSIDEINQATGNTLGDNSNYTSITGERYMTSDEHIERKNVEAIILSCIDKIYVKMRKTIHMYYFTISTPSEICKELGISRSLLSHRLHIFHKLLEKELIRLGYREQLK